jgi:hypothetical protein
MMSSATHSAPRSRAFTVTRTPLARPSGRTLDETAMRVPPLSTMKPSPTSRTIPLKTGTDMPAAAPYLRYLLSLGPADAAIAALDPRERRGGIFEALRRMILRAAERRPQIVVIEDLHWIDRATEDFLAVLGDSVPASPVLLIFTYRPGLRAALRGAHVPHPDRAGAPFGARECPHGRHHPRQRCVTRHAPERHRGQGRGQPVLCRGGRALAARSRRDPSRERPLRAYRPA